jgi:hypothetical protein
MENKVAHWLGSNNKIIYLTFEVFWIIIFILEMVTNENVVEIPQFIYVNF